MYIARYQDKQIKGYEKLYEACDIIQKPHMIISLVGGGGKTSTMYYLAEEFAWEGKRVIVTTTTHIRKPDEKKYCIMDQMDDVRNYDWKQNRILVVGKETTNPEKIGSIEEENVKKLAELADVLLIEADGSKQLPIKVPEQFEPVIIRETDIVIACLGLDAIGEPLEKVCFRTECAKKFLGVEENHILNEEDAAKILTDEKGSRKFVGNRKYIVVLNKADDNLRILKGITVARKLEKYGLSHCVLTSHL